MHPNFSVLAIAAALTSSLCAEVKPNTLFSDGAVLQRGQAIPVWGTARDGEKVTVEFQGQKATTTAANGKWSVHLDPLKEGGPFTMTLTGDNTVTVNNLLVGEVWLCSGQSNMNLLFSRVHNAAEEAPKANYPEIRSFKVPVTVSLTPLAEAKGAWIACSPETVNEFSGVGYFFARDIHRKLGVPIGLIHSALGATPAQAWTSLEGLKTDPVMQEYVDAVIRRRENYEAETATYPAKLAEHETRLAEWNETKAKVQKEKLKAWNEAVAKAKEAGQPAPRRPRPPRPPKAPVPPEGQPTDPAVLFNGMIAPLVPYGIKGVLWYQGESNSGRAKEYLTLFPAMIADWRTRWKQGDFPFLYVQVAPWGGMPPEIREAQFLSLGKVKNTAMTVTTDFGDADDIHPKQKEPVGQRLAIAARALAYGEAIEYSGPLYDSMKVEIGKIILSFQHVGGGLMAKDGPLKGFTIAGKDKEFVPARAEIEGSTIVVSADGVADPQAVRYGWANVPDVNLFNREGLPASPFRTDVD
ncbi:sialate O-acetylesterase [Akkermansiaceae bacterium]|nr:sialate O-acetylesterase [Akkermansiaceae bacterium]